MMYSMTGYGKAQAEINGKKVSVELKSLNSKQLDLFVRIAPCYKDLDTEIRNKLLSCLQRGKIDFSLCYENVQQENESLFNTDLIRSYHQRISELSDHLHIPQPSDPWACLIRMPDVLQSRKAEIDEEEWNQVRELIQEAIDQLVLFRQQEGNALASFFLQKIELIEQLLKDIEPFEQGRVENIKTRMIDNMNKIGQLNYDKNRFEQELIYYLEKLDITEEKTRLANHCRYFRETMQEDGKGKKLGFILQEMGREINTLGSKSNQAEMQRIVVCMKDELEKMKEQILNIL